MLVATFNCGLEAPGRQFDCFYSAVRAGVGRITPTPPRPGAPFRAEVVSRLIGERRAHLLSAPGHDAARTAADCRRDPCGDLHVVLIRRGARGFSLSGRDFAVPGGRMAFCPLWRPFRLHAASEAYAALSLALPLGERERARVERFLIGGAPALDSPLLLLLRIACASLARSLTGGSEREIETLVAVIERIALALADGAAFAGDAGCAETLHRAILAEIDRRAAEADFNLARLAAAVGVTPRRVQRLLTARGQCFTALRRRSRLVRARRAIEEGCLPIQQIAWEAGYAELSAFYRAFGRMFGSPPGALRRP